MRPSTILPERRSQDHPTRTIAPRCYLLARARFAALLGGKRGEPGTIFLWLAE